MVRKRDNSYYLRRLEKEHPAIYADWKAGRHGSAREALIAAGLRKPGSPFQALKSAWAKASAHERTKFLAMMRPVSAPAAPAPAKASVATSTHPKVLDADRRLRPAVAKRVLEILAKRGMSTGDLMREIGMNPLNQSMGNALSLHSPSRLWDDKVVEALEKWIHDNRHVK